MKTWEMIKELTEDPSKEFVSKGNKHFHVFMTNYGYVFYGIDGDGAVKPLELNRCLKQEWEEVKKPITFMEAVESGKLIRVEEPIKYHIENYYDFYGDYQFLSDFLWRLANDFSSSEVQEILSSGKFYIE